MPAKKDPPDDEDVVITKRLVDDRRKPRTIEHQMTHSPPCSTCEGCQARARQKKHHRGSFEKSDKDRTHIPTMDQVNIMREHHKTLCEAFNKVDAVESALEHSDSNHHSAN